MNILGLDPADVANLDNEELVRLARDAARARRLVEALEVTIAGEVDARSQNVPEEDNLAWNYGAKNATQLLTEITLASARAVRAKQRLAAATMPTLTLTGEMLPSICPSVADGLKSGALPLESAQHITQLIDRTKHTATLEEASSAEKHLVEAATGMDLGMGNDIAVPYPADQIRTMANAWLEALDPDGSLPDEADMNRRRYFRFGTKRNGMVPISGLMLPEVAASLGRLFDAFGNSRTKGSGMSTQAGTPGTSRDAGASLKLVDEDGSPFDSQNLTDRELAAADPRTPAQKRHDMLATILNVALRSKDTPTLGGAPVTVMIQVKEETFATGEGNAWLYDHEGTKTPVPAIYAQRAACSGAIQKVFQNESGRIIELGTLQRTFNQHQRRAITVRDGGCVIPGCTVPATWCEVHHVHEHAKGGKTHTDNGVLLCWHHHRHPGENSWQISMENGVPQVKPPPWLTRLWADKAA